MAGRAGTGRPAARTIGRPAGAAWAGGIRLVPAGRVCTVVPDGGENVDAGGLAVNEVRVTVVPLALE